MEKIEKFIQGVREFKDTLSQENRILFKKLASGQKPEVLMIGCSDSRFVPNLVTSAQPGELFTLRNIGNLVPPASAHETNVAAALEFSIYSVKVTDIIVCGHSGCVAMQTLAQAAVPETCPHLKSWLNYGEESLKTLRKGQSFNKSLSEYDQLSQLNVVQQMHHLTTYPFIQERIEKKQLRLHGWWFEIANAEMYTYEQVQNQFVLIC